MAPPHGAMHTTFMNASPRPGRLMCACGKPTEMVCFFADGEPHGVCEKCAAVRSLKLETGQTIYRFVCNRCWEAQRKRA
jgi:hypothetical protein